MLSESQVKQAKTYIFEYKQYGEYIDTLQRKISNPTVMPEYKEQWKKELADIKQQKEEIRINFQKEFNVDLQKLEDRTPLGIMNHVRKQEEERQQQRQPSPDRPHEITKQQPQKFQEAQHGTNRYIKPAEPKNPEPTPPTQEPQHQPQTPDHTLTVTHPEQHRKHHVAEPLRGINRYMQYEKQKNSQQPARDQNPEKRKDKGMDR